MQRALVFLGVVLAAVIIGWLGQTRKTAALQAELSAMYELPADPGSIVRVQWTTEMGPGAVDAAKATCPTGYRIVYGAFHSVSPDSKVFFADTFGSTRTWAVGLDNFDSKTVGSVTTVAACAPTDRVAGVHAEKAARRRVAEAVAEQEASHH